MLMRAVKTPIEKEDSAVRRGPLFHICIFLFVVIDVLHNADKAL